MKTLFALLLIVQFFFPLPFVSFLTLTMTIIWVYSIGYAYWISKKLKIEWEILNMDYHTGDQFRLYYYIKNEVFLPRIDFITRYKNLHKISEFYSEKNSCSQNKAIVDVSLVFREIGTYDIHLHEIKVYDFFHLVSFKKRIPLKTEVNIYPLPLKSSERDIFTEIIHGDDVQIYEKGDDYTEIYGFHTYRDNEPLKHVHPALSAKFDEYIIKEGSDTRKKVYTYPMKEAHKFFHFEKDLMKIYYMFLTIVLDKNEFFVVKYHSADYPIYSHYDLYYLMNKVYKEYLP